MVRRLRGSRRGVGNPALIAVAVLGTLAVLTLLPMPLIGLPYYNVKVTTTIGETCVFACSYSVQSVNPSVTGGATILDIAGWLGIGQNIAGPCLDCQYKVTAALSNGQAASVSETKFVSNLINFAYTDTVSLSIAYVRAGTYGVTVTVSLNGGTIATGTGSITVG